MIFWNMLPRVITNSTIWTLVLFAFIKLLQKFLHWICFLFWEKKRWQPNLNEHQPKQSAKHWRGLRGTFYTQLLAKLGLSTSAFQMTDWSCAWLFMDLADIWLTRKTFSSSENPSTKYLFFKINYSNAFISNILIMLFSI